MMEPLSLPNWDILREDHQTEALEYMAKVDPDLLVVAWPCQYWSILQEFGRKTPEQLKKLATMREIHRGLLDLVRRAVKAQRMRGGAVLGENPGRAIKKKINIYQKENFYILSKRKLICIKNKISLTKSCACHCKLPWQRCAM